MFKHIFLAGGGSAADSKLFDERFAAVINVAKPLVYIPNAMRSQPYESCFKWLRSVMLPFGVTKIEMWADLQPRYAEVNSIAGIYIGGGDTVKLLRELRESGFDNYLLRVITIGLPVYGGSAGAIILGEDIRTSPEARSLNAPEAVGLKIIPGYSVVCHYDFQQEAEVKRLTQLLSHGIIAIPKKAGGYFCDDRLTNYGTEPISIFQGNEISQLEPNHSIKLLARR